jgi:nifR3 family TIM-barrel protein
MVKGFWQQLKTPIFSLAPMADVTDVVFRDVIAKYSCHDAQEFHDSPTRRGGPDVFWTEFVASDGLIHPEAREKLIVDLKYHDAHRPIVAQLFGNDPDTMREAAKLCRELGFDGIDINMGCPERNIVKQGAGCGMIKDPKLAVAVIKATQEGAGDVPVSVKTRLGFSKNEIETWVPALLSADIPVLTIHMRTKTEMSKVPPHWNLMTEIVRMRDELSPETLIFGNGDVTDLIDAKQKVTETGCDGVMLGRAIFGNPWLFDEDKNEVTVREKLTVMLEHTKLYEEELGEHKNFNIMKKHYKAYVNGFPHAKDLRIRLMDAENYSEIEKATKEFMEQNPDLMEKVTDKHFDPSYR